MASQIPVSIEGEYLGDLIGGSHGVTFYSVRAELLRYDGRTYASVQEARTALRAALWGQNAPLRVVSGE